MKNTILLILTLVLLLPITHSACPQASRDIQVPAAVSHQEGELLKITVAIAPGEGVIYTTIRPTTGTMTQQSQFDAISYAFSSVQKKIGECEIKISFDDMKEQTPSIEGPSAGLAMAIATKAALELKDIREDVAVTGAIDAFGNVHEVGGIIDKAQAAALANKSIIITPKQRIFENIILSQLEQKYSITILEVKDFETAYEVATSDSDEIFESVFDIEKKSIPKDLPKRELREVDIRFSSIASNINQGLRRQVMSPSDGLLSEYINHFENEIELNEMIIDKGYAYTAANNAFLSQVDAAFISTPPRKLNLEEYVDKAQQCLARLEPVELTDNNFEWVAGADARRRWAERKIEDVKNITTEIIYQEEKYLALREIYYAIFWCEASGYLYEQAQDIGGMSVDSKILKPMAEDNMKLLDTMMDRAGTYDADAQWHRKIAEESIKQGEYAAAIFDIAYSSAMQKTTTESIGMDEGEPLKEVTGLVGKEFDTLWGRTYQSQGIYSFYKEDDHNKTASEALRVLRLSENMQYFMSEAQNRIENPPEEFVYMKREEQTKQIGDMIVGVIILGSIVILLIPIINDILKKRI
jgi:predicted S18 family serine protease